MGLDNSYILYGRLPVSSKLLFKDFGTIIEQGLFLCSVTE